MASAPAVFRRRRRRARSAPGRRSRRLVAFGVVVVAMLAGLAVRLVVLPATDPLPVAVAPKLPGSDEDEGGTPVPDAVLVLAGSGEAGVQDGLALVNGGVARVLVLVLVLPAGDDSVAAGADAERLCVGAGPVEVRCLAAGADGRADARALAALIDERGWRAVVLIAERTALSRAALQLGRCSPATVIRRSVRRLEGADLLVAVLGAGPAYARSLFLQQSC